MNGEGSWTQRDNGKWKLSVSYKGVGRKYFYGTKQECLQKKKEFESLLSTDIVGTDNKIIFKIFAQQWLKEVKGPTIKPASYDRMEDVLERQIYPLIGDLELGQIDEHIIQVHLINQLKNDGYSRGTIKHAHTTVKQVLDYAVFRKKIQHNPVKNIKLPKQSLFETKERKAFSADERKRFIDACYAINPNGRRSCYYGGFFVLMLFTGLRVGECSALKWSDIDMDKRYLTVSHTIVYLKNRNGGTNKKVLVDQNSTKSGRTRRVYLSDMAIKALNDLKEQVGYDPNGYVLHTSKGTFLFPGDIQKRFHYILHRAGIEPCGVHTLRHSYVSLLVNNNVPIAAISELVGHTSISITLNVYSHLLQETRAEAMEIIKTLK